MKLLHKVTIVKIRLESVIIILLATVALATFLPAPLMVGKAHFEYTNMYGNFNYDVTIYVKYDGTSKQRNIGIYADVEVDNTNYYGADRWESYGFYYPMVVKFMTSISLGLCFAAGILMLFGDKKLLKILGAIIGILFGITAFVGEMLFLNFAQDFRDYYEPLGYEINLSAGFILPIILGILIAIGSGLSLVLKPMLILPKTQEVSE